MAKRPAIAISHATLWMGAALLVASALFYAFPTLDLWGARQLYTGNGNFILENNELAHFFRKEVDNVLKYGFLLFIICYLISLMLKFKLSRQWHMKLIVLFSSIILSEIVIINMILKDFWGRARPSQILEFGGTAQFTRAWEMADQCNQNCSFVSGHAGMAACTALLAILLPPKFRPPYLCAAILFTAAAGFMRMGLGAHFLSDVLIAPLIVWFTALLMRDFIVNGR